MVAIVEAATQAILRVRYAKREGGRGLRMTEAVVRPAGRVVFEGARCEWQRYGTPWLSGVRRTGLRGQRSPERG